MRIYDLIAKKRDGGTHSREELEAIVNGFVSGEVADYQMAAWMMAVYLRGMTDEETAELTDVMAHSGVMVDLSPIPGIKVDKHSTGGVGDKTTLVIAPIVAACGVKIAKMSGRGLGHTGGTIDKMESVPGTKTALSQEEFFAQVNKIGLSVIGQSEGIAVADKDVRPPRRHRNRQLHPSHRVQHHVQEAGLRLGRHPAGRHHRYRCVHEDRGAEHRAGQADGLHRHPSWPPSRCYDH